MSSDPPPSYPGGPSAPLLEEKNGQPPYPGNVPPTTNQPVGNPIPPSDIGPPPYEPPPQPGFISPHVPVDGGVPYPPHVYYPPPGNYPLPPGYYPPPSAHYPPTSSQYPPPAGHTATVIVPPGAATTVTVLQGEMFQAAPVQTVCPHCQQAITTKITHEIGLMNTFFCLLCCFVGCDLGCCLIPCVIDDLKDVTHTCPNCKAYIYTYKRLC
ncbi:cell death-inducing p53-target protein 1 [Latimeria chalumnae]|uniref:Cell death-inducing p53-target protein 1 n=1 Tax=Latimeria chalumnae TaxID=7897 RepID=H3B4B1_LATCH|nr:PREDICTED: cell death-inducing p53-target protein 1 [Latimeria chalumnae]|eukprot:XP_005990866.1 PREDICTED: cell death-inducing p53-target protein 1 [Latimeria chalumnae]